MSLKKAAISGVKWTSFSFVLRRILAFGTIIIMAHLLSAHDFGLVAMASLALGFIELFKDLGTGSAVIQRKDVSAGLLSSIFWINVCFGLVVTVGLYELSPLVAKFYREPAVVPLVQVLSFSFFISALGIVQSCLLSRNMAFELQAKFELITAIFSSIAGISFAWLGFGVMSLVYQPLLNSILMLTLLWTANSWRPQWVFNWNDVREIAGYSLNLSAYNVFNYFARNADNLLIGRYLSAEDLGFYDLAYRLMIYPLQGISAVVAKVMFPLYSQMQGNHERFRSAYLSATGAIALFSFPLMLGLLAVSQSFVLTLFGEQWLPIVPLLMFFAPLGALQSITTTVGSIYQATGRTDLLLRWGVGSSIFVMLAFVIGLRWGIVGVASAYTCAYLILLIPWFAFPFRLINLRLLDLVKVLWRSLLCSMVMCFSVMAITTFLPLEWSRGTILIIMISFGVAEYIALTLFFNRKHFLAIVAMIK